MTNNRQIITAEDFMNYFEHAVQSYGDEFFFNGARDLRANLEVFWVLEKNHDAVYRFLRECLLATRDEPRNPPEIDFVRNKLRTILDV